MTEIKWSDFAAIVLPAKRNETTQNQSFPYILAKYVRDIYYCITHFFWL